MKPALLALAAFAAAVGALPVHAQQYPNRPITMVVPFPPGGIADITGRPLAVAMAKQLGQPVVVENKADAGGAVGHAFVAKAKPDGYTIMTALSSIVVIPEADLPFEGPLAAMPARMLGTDHRRALFGVRPTENPVEVLENILYGQTAKDDPESLHHGEHEISDGVEKI